SPTLPLSYWATVPVTKGFATRQARILMRFVGRVNTRRHDKTRSSRRIIHADSYAAEAARVHHRKDNETLQTACALSAGRRPAGSDPPTARGAGGRTRRPDPARRDGVRQDLHHRQRHPRVAASG